MPRDLVNRLSASIGAALRRPEVVQQLALEATTPVVMGPDETKAFIEAEVVKYIRLAKEAGIQPE
jgi:tripartite-type tricarboxylate transporter receptor subunit TctC